MSDTQWLLVGVGLALIGAAAVRQLIHGWTRHGLTHTLYSSLLAYALGSLILAVMAAQGGIGVVALVCGAPALVSVAAVAIKLADHARTKRWIR